MTDTIDEHEWRALRRLFAASFTSSFHFAVASAGAQGEPWVTPVGSVLLHEPGRATYFELYARGLGHRLSRDPRVSVLAVDSAKLRWLAGLVRGRFARAPAVRLRGRAAASTREATEAERHRFLRRVRGVRHLKGGRALWGDLDAPVRDLWIDRVEPVRLGALTR